MFKTFRFKSVSAFLDFTSDKSHTASKDFKKYVVDNDLIEKPFLRDYDETSCHEKFYWGGDYNFDSEKYPNYVFSSFDLDKYCIALEKEHLVLDATKDPDLKCTDEPGKSIKLNLEVKTKEQAESLCKLLEAFF